MSYAVIKTGGKQYRVIEGQTLLIERLPDDVGRNQAIATLVDVPAAGAAASDSADAGGEELDSKPRRRGRRGGRRRSRAKAPQEA